MSRRNTGRILTALALAGGTAVALGVPGAHATTPPPVTTTFAFAGTMQSYHVPAGICAVTVVAQAGAGKDFQGLTTFAPGGQGAVITATVPVPAEDTLSVLVGGSGASGSYGGGGANGGGASVVATSQPTPLVVAGGGGGGGIGTFTNQGYTGGSPGGNGGAIGANGGGYYPNQGGTSAGVGGNGVGRSTNGGAGAGGGGVTTGGYGASSGDGTLYPNTSAGSGGTGNGIYGGGGGGLSVVQNTDGGNGGGHGQNGSSTAGGAGNTQGGNGFGGSGGGGLGFGGGGEGASSGGGAGWGGGGGGGTTDGLPGGGGSSHVISTATNVSSGLGSGNGQVSISYDPAVDACAGTPSNPDSVTATPEIGAARVSFTAPASAGTSAITAYTVTATDTTNAGAGGQTATGTNSPLRIDGLHPGDTYTFKVHATNATGDGIDSTDSAPVAIANLPGAPTGVTAAAGTSGGTASVSFSAPTDNGGSAITGYSVTAIDTTTPANGGQGRTGTSSPIVVTGLTAGDHYTFTVQAINGVGAGAASAASGAVTPAAVQTASALTITSRSSATFTATKAGSFRMTVRGGRSAFGHLGGLPRGVSLSRTGVLHGTALRTAVGRWHITVVAVSGHLSTAQNFTLTVRAP